MRLRTVRPAPLKESACAKTRYVYVTLLLYYTALYYCNFTPRYVLPTLPQEMLTHNTNTKTTYSAEAPVADHYKNLTHTSLSIAHAPRLDYLFPMHINKNARRVS